MSSSPSSVKRKSPRRTPLQERTPSQANEISSRLGPDGRTDQENLSIYNTTPFPTKPAHILLPSTLRQQRSGPSPSADALGFSFESEAGRSHETPRLARGGAQPTVKLKRSVKALRDLYEAQAEEASRPSTATSPPLRPSTASSSRLRSISSNESLSGAYTWESLGKISSDDLALLPTLPHGGRAVKRLSSRSSFTSIAEKFAATSSPNYRVLGVTSSPRPSTVKDWTSSALEPFEEDPPSTLSALESSSSPNVVRLAHTSSTEQFPSTDQSSSPNVIKLGTSSPTTARPGPSNYSTHSRSSSSSSTKRKRSGTGGNRSFAERVGARNPLASSPPVDRYGPSSAAASVISLQDRDMPSSAPQSSHATGRSIDDSSPVVRMLGRDEPSSDGSSLAETHASLQAALSSSPPRIQYPVVRAPPISQHAGLVVPKRNSRSMSTDDAGTRFTSRLSAVPSEGSWAQTRETSESFTAPDDLDEYWTSDDLAPASTFIINESANQSQIRVVPDSDSGPPEVDSHEATDEVSALPLSEYVYRSPPLRHSHSGSYIGSANTSQSRLNSMKSFTQSRHNSFLSTSLRPSSSSSTISNVIPVPSWARRYYSGFYRDSFQYLYASVSHVNLHNLASPSPAPAPAAPVPFPAPSRPETSKSPNSPSLRNIHHVMTTSVESLVRPETRSRLEARKSHTLPGVGPLVSHPIREPATAALSNSRRQSYPLQSTPTHNRSVSAPLHPADPRAHWAGILEIHEQPLEDGRGSSYTIHHHHVRASSQGYSISQGHSSNQSVIYMPGGPQTSRRFSWSPHLHHDHRLNTGSSVSRGFGFPFNTKSRWSAASMVYEPRRLFSGIDLRTVQVVCFIAGFLLPFTWFVAAFLPLPKRPTSFNDLEKQAHSMTRAGSTRRQSHPHSQADQGLSEREITDIISQLRLERHLAGAAELKWQNARWWRALNRWMCAVGVVVCVLVIVLAVLGTKRDW
ncbi:uncharacterized protein Z518_00347 [Rhinocladiella mackenziei CBS 650.93]|uniref:Serine-rich protein n=1 Tax=Rhinocladiella mackenziei CBS 650.93 TaxID=1442369 RepID=A0A0D2HEZ5_9EURO|nr:uncharacterized protein Z518_00347 [Rhinocladiella mackenziei CBS 650.93]KIX09268.1 hypothetical protein Z518_00347 [Rhinocladiella mackenziei CBS 650.93]